MIGTGCQLTATSPGSYLQGLLEISSGLEGHNKKGRLALQGSVVGPGRPGRGLTLENARVLDGLARPSKLDKGTVEISAAGAK